MDHMFAHHPTSIHRIHDASNLHRLIDSNDYSHREDGASVDGFAEVILISDYWFLNGNTRVGGLFAIHKTRDYMQHLGSCKDR